MSPDIATAIDGLYGLPFDQFTGARDELARRLRKEGDRGAAEDVKKLRKPSVTAWALNQVSRSDPESVGRLLDAGDGLREAQRRLVEEGERGLLRQAAAEERSAVEQVVDRALRQLSETGHPAGAAVETKLRDTVQAAARHEEAREQLSAGRLVHEYVVSDLGLAGVDTGVAGTPARRARDGGAPPKQAERAQRVDSRKLDALRRRLDRAIANREGTRTALRDAEREAKDARRAAERATAVADRAEGKVERAREKAREAATQAEELEAELSELELQRR